MADIGDKLRSARKAKGMSIEDVEKITKIQRRYLTALENDDFDQLPGDFYVRAFIKQYAKVVGLNGNELLNDFHSEVPESKPDEYVENSIDNKSEEVRRTTKNKKGLWKSYLPKAAAIIGVFLIIFVVYLVYAHFFAPSANQQTANQADNVTVSSSSEASSSKKTVKKHKVAKSTVKLEKLGEHRYRVKDFKESKNRDLKLSTGDTETWAQITVDGQVKWQGTLPSNSEHKLELPRDVKRVSVQLGNSVSTKLSLANKNVEARNKRSPHAPLTINFVFGDVKEESRSSNTTTTIVPNTQSSTTTNNNVVNSTPAQSHNTTTTNNNQNQNVQRQPQNQQSSSQNTQPSRPQQNTQSSAAQTTTSQPQTNEGENKQ